VSATPSRSDTETYEFGAFRVDVQQQRLFRGVEPIALTPKSFQLLIVLLQHGTEIATKDELMQAVWPNTFVEETNLTRNIFALRKALGETDQDRYIVTVPGRGYRFARNARSATPAEVSVLAATHSKVEIHVRETSHWNRIGWVVAAALLVLFAGAEARVHLRRRPPLTAKDTVVLADFDNSTGEAVFDGTLRQGLAIQLEQSPYLSVVSDQRIRRTLKLMNKPADLRLTADAAAEICERTGAAAVLQGSIASVGARYVLGLRAKKCLNGDVLDEEQAQASRKEDVLNALSEIASRFRTRVGESLASVEKYAKPLQEATTSSLDALKAYTAGWEVHAVHGAVASLPLFRRAIELDPSFAVAHASLGRIYADLDQPDLAVASVERAWQLRDRTSEPEKFLITVNYEMLGTGNLEAAQQTCETWARAYPRETHVHSFLAGMISKTRGRYDRGLAEAQKAVELDPDDWPGYYSVGTNNLYLGRTGEAANALHAARARGLDADELIMLAYDIGFVTGDAAALQREAALARARPGGDNWMSAREAFVAAYDGHLSDARALSRRAVDEAMQAQQPERAALWEAGAAVREALFGDRPAAVREAAAALRLSHDREVEYGAALALALAGDASRAQSLTEDLERRSPENTAVRYSYVPVLRAVLALDRNEPSPALDVLQIAVPHELGVPLSTISALFGAMYPTYFRGLAFLAAHKGSEAAAEFQKVLEHRGVVITDPIGALARLQLGRSYALAGDHTKARAAYTDFLRLWKDADPQVPVLQQARAEYGRLQ
jgi:DNA-binding winged helix-turn-helix (wHTH) protein/tetratricopeptide (TPR) repeat protein